MSGAYVRPLLHRSWDATANELFSRLSHRTGQTVTPHMLRHAFGTGAAQAGSLDVVAELLGHASLRSTQTYLHPDMPRQRQAVEAGALSRHLEGARIMKGLRAALVLLPPDLGADSSHNPFEQGLDTVGWDADALQLRPSSTHTTLGWKKCAVDQCDRPAWGLKNNGLCEGCKTQWRQQAKPDRAIFDRQPPKRHRIQQHLTPCVVARNGVRCGRDAQNKGLCGPEE